jgi:hypothetical protein
MRSTARPAPAESAGRGSSVPLILASLALVVSVATALYSVYRDPFANRLSRYDFSTPEAAYHSLLRIEATADLPAMMELQRRNDARRLREKLDSASVEDAAECRGKTILFIEYTADSKTMHEIQCFEPDPNQPRTWRIAQISDEEIRAIDPHLANRVADWRTMRPGEAFLKEGRPRRP